MRVVIFLSFIIMREPIYFHIKPLLIQKHFLWSCKIWMQSDLKHAGLSDPVASLKLNPLNSCICKTLPTKYHRAAKIMLYFSRKKIQLCSLFTYDKHKSPWMFYVLWLYIYVVCSRNPLRPWPYLDSREGDSRGSIGANHERHDGWAQSTKHVGELQGQRSEETTQVI